MTIQEQIDELKKITGSSQLTGWVKENVAHFLSGFVRYADVNLVVNIGHLWGKSALMFCDAMFNEKNFETNWDVGDPTFVGHTIKSTNPSNVREVHSVDPLLQPPQWRPPNAIEGTKYINGLYPNFTFHHMKSDAFFDSGFDFSKYNRKLIFIDGDHTYEGALRDVKNAVKYKFDFIIIDDTSFIPHIEKAAKDGMTSEYDFISLPLWNGLNLLVRK